MEEFKLVLCKITFNLAFLEAGTNNFFVKIKLEMGLGFRFFGIKVLES